MSHAGVQMRSLSMMVPTHIFKPWCKCLLVGMPWCKCPLVGMPWCECFDANTIYSKIPFVFKIKASSAPKTKIFSNLDLLFLEKSTSIFFFYLRLPKKLVITVRKSSNGALTWNLMIWLKRFIFTIWLSKGVARFQGLFLKNKFFENQASLKDSFFF